MSEVLLVEITFNDKKWYLSEEGYMGESYYAPYLADSLSLELGEVKGGFIGVRLGNLSIANRPNDRFSPFSIFGGGYAALLSNPVQKIPIDVYWQQKQSSEAIFSGTMYLSSFDTDKFTFLLEDGISDLDLLDEAVDITSDFVDLASISIKGNGNTATVLAPDHGLFTGDQIRVFDATSTTNNSEVIKFNTLDTNRLDTIEVSITKTDDNSFSYTLVNDTNGNPQSTTAFVYAREYRMQTFTKKAQPFSFGVVVKEKDIIKTAERARVQNADGSFQLGSSSGDEFANPGLNHVPSPIPVDKDNIKRPLELFDDGVLVGSVQNNIGSLKTSGISIRSMSANPAGITRTGDLFTINTVSAHNLQEGQAVKILGVTGDLADILNTTGPFHIVDKKVSATSFNLFKRSGEVDGAITLDGDNGSSTSTAVIKTPGDYFGSDRLPTSTTIFSRAFFNNLASYVSGDASTVEQLDGFDHTSRDGTVIFGTPLVSGISKNGETLAEFFEFIRTKLNITNVDFSDATDASNIVLRLWLTTQTKVVEYAGEISYAANHLFEIKNDTIRVIDRSNIPSTFISLNNWEIVSAQYKVPTPVKALRSKWTSNFADARTEPTSLTSRGESVIVSNSESGEIVDITPITKDHVKQREMLERIRNIINKTVITIGVGNIRSDIKVGSRIKVNRDEDGVSIYMIVRTISFNFSELETEIVGDGTVTVIEQDKIY